MVLYILAMTPIKSMAYQHIVTCQETRTHALCQALMHQGRGDRTSPRIRQNSQYLTALFGGYRHGHTVSSWALSVLSASLLLSFSLALLFTSSSFMAHLCLRHGGDNEPLLILATPNHRLVQLPSIQSDDLEGEPFLLTEVGCGYPDTYT